MTQQVTVSQPTLPLEWGGTSGKRLSTMYYKVLSKKMGAKALIPWAKCSKIFNTLTNTYTEIQVASLLMAHMNYSPTVYPFDGWLKDNLPKRMWDIGLFVKSINVYVTYLIYDKKIEFDDLDTLKDVVYKYVERL